MMLPQARTLRATGDEVMLELALLADHEAFRDHFPEHPILAGVVQIDWAMRFAARYLVLDQIVAQEFRVKFRRMIGPCETLALTLRLDPTRSSVAFEYRIVDGIASSGKIRLTPWQ